MFIFLLSLFLVNFSILSLFWKKNKRLWRWLGHEADYSPPSSAEVKNGGAIPPLPHASSLSTWINSLIKYRDNFTFYKEVNITLLTFYLHIMPSS
jgi:hypothetical protein